MKSPVGRAALAGLVFLLIGLLAACGQEAPGSPGGGAQPGSPAAGGGPMVPILAVSELTVGPNRLALGVLQDGTPLNDPELRLGLRFFYLDGDTPDAVQGESTAVYRGEGLPFGLYVGYNSFDQPGGWGMEVSIPQADGSPEVSRVRLDVLAQPKAPAVGNAAVPSQNLTVAEEPDLGKLTSDASPDAELYQLTVADAIAAQKPFLVAFSTPGYCQTAVCAPNMQVIKELKEQYKERVNFIHVEVYPYPFGESFQAQRRVPAMEEWGLRTEPWTFLVDGAGVIQARYEGGITFAELGPALEQLAAGEPITPPAE